MNAQDREIQAIIFSYVDAAISYGEALKKGNHLKANESHSVLSSIFRQLVDLGSGEAVLSLLDNENQAVRYWAAVNALSIAPCEAESVLVDVVNSPPGPIRLMAQISLSEWRKRK